MRKYKDQEKRQKPESKVFASVWGLFDRKQHSAASWQGALVAPLDDRAGVALHRGRPNGLAVFSIAVVTITLACTAIQVDREKLDTIEDLSESLANDLLDLSVATRRQDLARMAEYFPTNLKSIPFPDRPEKLAKQTETVSGHGWALQREPIGMTREQFLAQWAGFLAHFSEIEDVRFKVKHASFEGPTLGEARLAFFLIGRGCGRNREWVRGTVSVKAVRNSTESTEKWKLYEFLPETIESLVATRDMFSEVSTPAGVAVTLPPYGSPGNEGFVWHGAAAADIDGDGDIDLFVTGPSRNYLYLNDGNGRFRESAQEAGLEYLSHEGVAPLFLDYDNDGDQDLFVSAVGPQILLQNRLKEEGELSFADVSLESGVAVPAIGFSAVAGDVNGDGLPEIYVASYNRYGMVMPNSWDRATNGTPNLLFVNQGDGRFKEMGKELGVADSRWSYAAQFADFDGDGDQDLYIANDFGENGLFVNYGGRFVDETKQRGALDPGNGMGVSFGDYDNDGLLDLHVTNMSSTAGNRILGRLFPDANPTGQVLKKLASGNSLYEIQSDGSFKDATQDVGGFSAGWAWGGGFIDFNNDGWEDIYTPNGFISGKSMKDT